MRVLHLIDTFWLGGAQTLLKTFFENQFENKDIFLYGLRKRNENIEINHTNVVLDPSPNRFSFGRIKRINKYIIENNISILHCHLPHSQFIGYLIKQFYNPNIKLILHDHSDILEAKLHIAIAFKICQKKADKVITCSEHLVKPLIDKANVPEGKILVVNNFIDYELFNANNSTNIIENTYPLLPENAFVVGFAGRFVKRKGWNDFLKAAEMLNTEKNIYFFMAGTGPDLYAAKKIASAFSNKQVYFLGFVKNMPEFYKSINLFVMPSHWEGMPLAPLEALSMQKPVIVSNGKGLSYSVGIDKFLNYFEVGNIEQLRDLILEQYKNPLNINFIPANDFSCEYFISRLNSLYRSLK